MTDCYNELLSLQCLLPKLMRKKVHIRKNPAAKLLWLRVPERRMKTLLTINKEVVEDGKNLHGHNEIPEPSTNYCLKSCCTTLHGVRLVIFWIIKYFWFPMEVPRLPWYPSHPGELWGGGKYFKFENHHHQYPCMQLHNRISTLN